MVSTKVMGGAPAERRLRTSKTKERWFYEVLRRNQGTMVSTKVMGLSPVAAWRIHPGLFRPGWRIQPGIMARPLLKAGLWMIVRLPGPGLLFSTGRTRTGLRSPGRKALQ